MQSLEMAVTTSHCVSWPALIKQKSSRPVCKKSSRRARELIAMPEISRLVDEKIYRSVDAKSSRPVDAKSSRPADQEILTKIKQMSLT